MVVVPMVPGKVVGVYIERDANATVSELLLDVFGIRPLLDEERGKGVAQVMKGDMPQVGPRETGLEPVRTSSLLFRWCVGPKKIQGTSESPFMAASSARVSFTPKDPRKLRRHIHAPDLTGPR